MSCMSALTDFNQGRPARSDEAARGCPPTCDMLASSGLWTKQSKQSKQSSPKGNASRTSAKFAPQFLSEWQGCIHGKEHARIENEAQITSARRRNWCGVGPAFYLSPPPSRKDLYGENRRPQNAMLRDQLTIHGTCSCPAMESGPRLPTVCRQEADAVVHLQPQRLTKHRLKGEANGLESKALFSELKSWPEHQLLVLEAHGQVQNSQQPVAENTAR